MISPSRFFLGVACVTLCVTACTRHAPTPAAPQGDSQSFDTRASIRELMDSVVDPAADGLWESVAIISDAKGVDRREPRTDEEWKAVRRHAVALIEGMNLVMMKGRKAAPNGTPKGDGELSPAEIDALLASDHDTLDAFAQNVQRTARIALAAIDRRDAKALFEAGSEIDHACESCHVTFWYPGTQDPRLDRAKSR